jgi:hypothetical protein
MRRELRGASVHVRNARRNRRSGVWCLWSTAFGHRHLSSAIFEVTADSVLPRGADCRFIPRVSDAPAMPCAWARRLHDEPAVMTETRADDVEVQDTLREQETEFYETLTAVLANLPPGSTVDDALRSPAGERARRKWMLKYGREAPL